jgi:cysteine synthase
LRAGCGNSSPARPRHVAFCSSSSSRWSGIANSKAFETARDLARHEGILGGISSGAAVAAALELGGRPRMAGKNIVVILPSFAERDLSATLFEGL